MKPSPTWWALGVLTGVVGPALGLHFLMLDCGPCGNGNNPAAGITAIALLFPALPLHPLIDEYAFLAVPVFWAAVPLLIGRWVESRKKE